MSIRAPLTMPQRDDDLDDFAPRRGAGQGAAMPPSGVTQARKTVDAVSAFPSREAPADGQLNLKGPQHVLNRFKAMCKADRRTYYDMLEILMDSFEARH